MALRIVIYADTSEFVLTMLSSSVEKQNYDIIHYLIDTFNPTRYNYQGKWVYTRYIALCATGLKLETFRLLWQYNHEINTRVLGHLGNPLGSAVLRNDLPLAEFMLQHGADPVNHTFCYTPISRNDYRLAKSKEMKKLLKRYAKGEAYH